MADVKISWVQFDTAATPCDVRVSWLQFDTSANPCDVRVSWCLFDTAAAPCDVRVSWCQFDTDAGVQPATDGRSGYWRLFYTQLQEQALAKKKKPKVEPDYQEPYAIKEQKDGSVVIEFPAEKSASKPLPEVRPPFKRLGETESPNLPQTVLTIDKDVQLLIAQYNLFAIQSQKILDDQDDDDVEILLLLVA